MAKIIKKVGIIFFVLVISCLLVVGCLFASTNIALQTETLKTQSSGEIVDSEKATDVGYTPDVILTGTTDKKAALWSGAIQKSFDGNNKEIKVLLDSDWVAHEDTYFFGVGKGFYNGSGSITVPHGATIIFDLNGHTLDKKQTTKMSYGSIFTVLNGGTLTIIDSKYDSELMFNTYEENKDKPLATQINALRALPFGKITGGACMDTGGGIFIQSNAKLTFNGGMIIDNIYAPAGGAICAAGELIVNGGLFMNNCATKTSGAAFHCKNNTSISNSIIIGNKSSTESGAIMAAYSINFEMNNVVFSNNTSKLNGGALNVFHENTKVTINDCVFYKNESEMSGAGICSSGITTITNCNFVGNVAKNSGGAIFNNTNSSCTIDSCLFENNSSAESGGGIYNSDNIALMSISNSEIKGNTAKYGGGICTFADITSIKNTIITGNHATENAGGIHTGNLRISGATVIKDNSSDGKYDDLYLTQDIKVEVVGLLTSEGKDAHIQVDLNDNYNLFETFTLGYTYYGNGNQNPSKYFFTKDNKKVAVLKNEEVIFDLKEKSIYDFVYLDNGYRKTYTENDKLHGYNDSELERYVLGNIKPNTSVNEFVNNLAPLGIDKNNLQLSDSKGKTIYQNGAVDSGINSAIADNGKEMAIGTGWYIQTNGETIYLSVLGDVNGDGRISASDVSYLREIASDNALYESLSVEKKLASMVINKGEITTADAEIVRNVIDKIIGIELFY